MKSPFDNTPDNADQASSSVEDLAVSLGDLAKNSRQTRVEVNLSTRDLELMRKDLQSLSRQMDRQASAYWKNPQTHPAFAPGAGSQQPRPVPAQVQAQADQRRLTDAINHLSRLIESRGTGGSSTAQTAVTALGLAQVQQALSGQTTVLQGLGQTRTAQAQTPAPTVQSPSPPGAVSQTLAPYLRQLDLARAGGMDREDLRGSLEQLPGYQLKELRDLTGGEPGGRSNADVIERILGTVPAYQREEPEASQPTAPPAQLPDQTQSAPPATVQAPQQPEQPPAQPPAQPTAPSSVHAPFSLAAMRSQWEGNPPPTEEEIEKRMESMKMPELKALRDEMKGDEGGRSKEDIRERIRAAHKRQQQEYQAFLASQASAPTTATADPPQAPTVVPPAQSTTPTTQAPTTGTPATIASLQAAEVKLIAQLNAAAEQMERLGGDDLRRAAERLAQATEQAKQRLTAAATPPAAPPGIPPGAPPSAPDPSGEGEEPRRRRPRAERPRTPAAPDLGELERRLPGMNEDELRRERDRLGLKGGRSNDELRSKIFQGARQMHRDEFTQAQNTAYDRARSQYLYQRLILPEIDGSAHQRAARMQAAEGATGDLYRAKLYQSSQQARAGFLATEEGKDTLKQTAQAQSQGDQSARLNALKQQVELEKQKAKLMASPQGRQALKDEANLQRELARNQGAQAWEKMVAEQGKFGAGLSVAERKLGELQRKFSGVGQSAGNLWMMGTAGITGLVAAADPFSTFPTLQESVKGLAIELGQGFLPIVDSVSQKIQGLTHWFAGLDESTKKNIATYATYAVAGAGVVYALYKIAGASYAAVGAVNALNLAWRASPWGFVISSAITATAAIGGLAAAYYTLGSNARGAGDGMASAADKAELKRREDEKRSVYESLPSDFKAKYREAKDEEGRRGVLREYQKKTKEDLEKAKASQLDDVSLEQEIDRAIAGRDLKSKAAGVDLIPGRGGPFVRPRPAQTTPEKEAASILKDFEARKLVRPENREEIRKILEEKAKLGLQGKDFRGFDTRRREFTQEKTREKIAQLEAQYQSATRLMERTGTQDGGLMRAYRNMPAPQITDPMSYADRIQIQALKGDDLTAKNMARQLEALDKNTGLLKDVKDELRILNTEVRRNYRGH